MGEAAGFVDLTQDEAEITANEEMVDLSQLSTSSSEDEAERNGGILELTSPERHAAPAPTKALYKEGCTIHKLLQMERDLRQGLLQRQQASATDTTDIPDTNRVHLPPSQPSSQPLKRALGAATDGSTPMTAIPMPPTRLAHSSKPKSSTRGAETSKKAKPGDKEEAAALKKIQKQFESEKYVLKFVKVVLSPPLMGGVVGLGVAQAFQQTASQPEHERISYEVSNDTANASHPLILWKRTVPSSDTLGEFEEMTEPFAMLCFEGAALVELICADGGKLDAVLDGLCVDRSRTNVEEQVKIYILAYRLEQHIVKRQQQDHREAVIGGHAPVSDSVDIRQALSDLVIFRPNVEIFDASSVDEASGYVVSITKAIALRKLTSQGCSSKSKFIAGKSKKQHGVGSTLNSLLLKDPLPEVSTYAVRALTAIPSVTPQIAHILVKTYGSLRGIYEFLEDQGSDLDAKRKTLENLRTFGGQRTGPVAARKLIDFLFADDPATMIE